MQSQINTTSLPSLLKRLPFFYGWIILSVASLGMFISGPGQTFSFSMFVDPIIRETGWSRSLVSGLYTAGSLTASIGMFIVGRLLDKLGARTMLVSIGMLFGFGALWMSGVTVPLELYIGFAIMRFFGQGSLGLVSETLIAMWFVRLRGRAMALSSVGMVASQAIFPVLIFFLITHVGWRNTWVAIAFIIWAVLILPAYLLVRRNPESVGLLPDGDIPSTNQLTNGSSLETPEVNITLRDALRTRTFYLLVFATTAQSSISTAMTFHHVSIITTIGLTPSLAAAVLAVMAPMALLGNILAGFLADKIPNRFVVAVAPVIIATAMIVALWMSNPVHVFIYGGMLGFGTGYLVTASSVIWPNYYGRRHIGSIRGIATTGMVSSAALGPLPFGLLFDMTGSYALAIMIFLLIPCGCVIAAIMAIPPKLSIKNP